MKEIKNNNPQVINEIILNRLYQYAFNLTQQRDDAYDLLQGALESYLKKNQSNESEILNPQSFLMTLIRNRFIDQYRYQQRWKQESYEVNTNYDISPFDLEKSHINQSEVEEVYKKLSAQERDIFYHWAILGYSTDEACVKLGMTRGTFLSKIHRLRKHIKNNSELMKERSQQSQ